MKTIELTQEENMNLPIPRLEIRHRDPRGKELGQGYNIVAEYRMIYEHLEGNVLAVDLGKTLIGGSVRDPLDTPFRMGAQIIHDMLHLHLPGYVINGKACKAIPIDREDFPGYVSRKLSGENLRKFKKSKK